ncbi:MAG: lysophospholipid acyltransferase family protein [Pseudomonadota bacterium]
MRRWLRISRLILHIVRGLLICACVFPFASVARHKYEIRRWSAQLLGLLAVRLHVHGAADESRPLMLVANHVSWLDIASINAVLPVRFIAKSEIRQWPLVGWLAECTRTLFIRRARRRDTAVINTQAKEALLAGDVVAVFPEGGASDGTGLLKFHSSLLEPAIAVQANVQPVAIRYLRSDGSLCTEAVYFDRRSTWHVLLAMTTQRRIEAHVWFLQPIDAQLHRRELVAQARAAIAQTLFPGAPSNHTETRADRRAAER